MDPSITANRRLEILAASGQIEYSRPTWIDSYGSHLLIGAFVGFVCGFVLGVLI